MARGEEEWKCPRDGMKVSAEELCGRKKIRVRRKRCEWFFNPFNPGSYFHQ